MLLSLKRSPFSNDFKTEVLSNTCTLEDLINILLADYDEEWIGRRIRDTYTRYHSCTTTIVQDPHTLLFFVSIKPFLFGFGDVKEVNANPGKTRTDCRNEPLYGLFNLSGIR
jgi:hypothetical protein